jgi:hypothetical protein
MLAFANALAAESQRPNDFAFLWLAGLLEAEGTFLKPPPSSPHCPVISCRMTDRDVVERVAESFGTRVGANDKGRYRTEYAATLKGSRAVSLMTELRPVMGMRRRSQIDRALAGYVPPTRKLSFENAEEIRRRHARGESVAALARCYGVARQTIYPLLKHQIYRSSPGRPWRESVSWLGEPRFLPDRISRAELYWLSGWLEGEGSFCAPPPSDPRRPRISGHTRDRDVASEVGRLLRIKPLASHDKRARERGWSPTWRVLRPGTAAIEVMCALKPLMGARRTRQIEAALEATTKALGGTRPAGLMLIALVENGGEEIRTPVPGRDAKASTGLAGALVSSSGSAPAGESERPVS